MDIAGICNRAQKLGLRTLSDSYKDALKQINLLNGMTRKQASPAAWKEMYNLWEPVIRELEKKMEELKNIVIEPPTAPQLKGLPEDLDSVLDENYIEIDQGKQLRDGLLWAAMEFGRVIRDDDDGPVARIDSASVAPPNAFALFTLSTYALSPIDKRRDLIARALSFATKASDPVPEPNSGVSGGFLDSIE